VKRLLAPGHDWSILDPDLKEMFYHAAHRSLQSLSAENAARPNTTKIDLLYLNSRMGRWHGRYYASTFQLMPCSTLFLTGELLELMFRLPWYAKYKNYMYRHLLEASHPALAREPMGDNLPATPVSPAHGGAHLAYWLRSNVTKVQGRIGKGPSQQRVQGPDIHGRILGTIHDAFPLTDFFYHGDSRQGSSTTKASWPRWCGNPVIRDLALHQPS